MRADRSVLGRRALVALLAAGWIHVATAASEPAPAAVSGVAQPVVADQALEDRVQELSHKLRCLVCQNQSIAESHAPLALDLRNQVREQLAAGKSPDDVLTYLVDRYGDFVLYDPPFKATTLLLWGGPAALLLAGAGWLLLRLRRRQQDAALQSHLTDAERARARSMLAGDPPAAADSPSAEESRS